MFGIDLYPSTPAALDTLFEGEDVTGKVCYDPSAGTGNVVERCVQLGAATVLATELDDRLRVILGTQSCQLVGTDFLKVTSEQVSSVQFVVMNPPYSKGDQHVLHAFAVAPPGCRIHAIVNWETVKNPYSRTRTELASLIETYGSARLVGQLFKTAERRTHVEVGMIRLDKPGAYSQEFDGFFLSEEPEAQVTGIASYNLIRDVVNRYVECVKIYDQQLETAVRLNELRDGYLSKKEDGRTDSGPLSIAVSRGDVPLRRNQFKKEMQKSGWQFVFKKMNLQKYATKGLKEDINKFVETQEQVPFTMRNVYRLLEIVVGTQESRMDQAALEVFDKVTRHCDDNRWNLEGWKTNSHFLLTKRFIAPHVVSRGWHGEVSTGYGQGNHEMLEDLIKVLCHLTGKDYNDERTLHDSIHTPYVLVNAYTGVPLHEPEYDFVCHVQGSDLDKLKERWKREFPQAHLKGEAFVWGKWTDWSFFRIKPFKKGTLHLEFKDEKVWATFNQRIAKLKGFPLPESKPMTAYQRRQHGRKEATTV